MVNASKKSTTATMRPAERDRLGRPGAPDSRCRPSARGAPAPPRPPGWNSGMRDWPRMPAPISGMAVHHRALFGGEARRASSAHGRECRSCRCRAWGAALRSMIGPARRPRRPASASASDEEAHAARCARRCRRRGIRPPAPAGTARRGGRCATSCKRFIAFAVHATEVAHHQLHLRPGGIVEALSQLRETAHWTALRTACFGMSAWERPGALMPPSAGC